MAISTRENMLRVYRHEEPDYLPLDIDIQTVRTIGHGILQQETVGVNTAGGTDEVDFFGQNWKFEPVIDAFNPDASNYIIKDVAEWRRYVTIPDLEAIDLKARFEKEDIQLDRENKLILVRDPIGIWERAFSMIEATELLTGLLTEPEAMYDFFKTIADHKIKLQNYYIDYYKPDVLAMHDDYGSGQGLFMSPATWRELIKPHLQRIIDNVRLKGVMYEHHCCGQMGLLAEEIAAMGAVSWNTVHSCNDPYECKKKFGDKIAFTGGMLDQWFMDAPHTTEDEVRAHVRDVLAKMLPGYVFVSGKTISNPERNAWINDEILKSGQQYYKEKRPA